MRAISRFLIAAAPLLPWPSNAFTKPDPSTDTGRRLNLSITQMPSNIAGKPIDPTEFNRNDGFSPGTLIAVRIPGLDNQKAIDASAIPPIIDPKQSLRKSSPVQVVDVKTGKRHLVWGELEYPDELGKDPSVETLVIHPARNFAEGHTYEVRLKNLRSASGTALEAPKPWRFTIASQRNLSERMLSIRDRAFAGLGDTNLRDLKVDGASPQFVVNPDLPDALQTSPLADVDVAGDYFKDLDGVVNFAPCSAGDPKTCEPGESDRVLRLVRGRVLVPCFLDTPGCAEGGTFAYASDDEPLQVPGNTAAAPFWCIIPRAVLTRGPGRPALYGHGLLGSGSQVTGGPNQDLANEHDIVSCATDWSGMSQEDLPNVAVLLGDLSRFASLADRGQQGMLNFLFLGRALIHPDGFTSDPAFVVDGKPAIDTSRLYYTGGSQGGIMGGSLTAVAPDFTRAALGVPGMNYSLLLQRSVDFDTYAQIMYNAYPDELNRPVILSLVQLLWDRAEADGYAQHMTRKPYPNTPAHEVILNMAWGDHQVTNWSTLVEARTIGAHLRAPALEASRSYGDSVFARIPVIDSFPATGSLFGVWDVGPMRTVNGQTKGTPMPPVGNVPNRLGVDPHGPDASEQATARAQVSAFLRPNDQSAITNACGSHACYLDGWTGP